ncbi:hypothetical protein C8R43DRAFT_855226, partial [Mycena crocata]
GGRIWLRATAHVGHGGSTADFEYSTDGSLFTSLGSTLQLNTNWTYFIAYRFAIFNDAMMALGGKVVVGAFTVE